MAPLPDSRRRPIAGLQDQWLQPARMFKALSHPTRVRLLSLIAAAEAGEACISDLAGPGR